MITRLPHRRRREPRFEAQRLEQRHERRRGPVAVPTDPGDRVIHHLVQGLEPPGPPVVGEEQQVVERHGHQVCSLEAGEAGDVMAHAGRAEAGQVGVDTTEIERHRHHAAPPATRPTQRKTTSSSAVWSGKVHPGSDSFNP